MGWSWSSTVKTSAAFSPCQITGFFRIHDQSNDLTRVGSTGAGVNIEDGVATRVRVRKGSRPTMFVELNGNPLRNPVVSRGVIGDYLAREGQPWSVRVNHLCGLPVGTGYGTSGAAAASLSLALNEALGDPFNRRAALAIAHVAEVKAKTGLGTVASVSVGGFAVRVRPGAPGVGEVKKLSMRRSLRVVSGSFGPILTRQVLSSRSLGRRVNLYSGGLVGRLLRRPDEKNFAQLSRSFADRLGLISTRLQRVLRLTDMEGVGASMMMLGDGAFCLVPEDSAEEVGGLMGRAGLRTVTSRIYPRGAHLL